MPARQNLSYRTEQRKAGVVLKARLRLERHQAPFALAAGAFYIGIHSAERLGSDLARAFHMAVHQQRNVVVGIPEDLQHLPVAYDYRPSMQFAVARQKSEPDPVLFARAAEWIDTAHRPLIPAGWGAGA